MCWEMDYQFFVEQQKAQEARIKEEKRANLIGKLLGEAQKHTSDDEPPVKEVVPAK